jgi:hypothetical protein
MTSWKTPEYRAWSAMKLRCANPNNEQYHNYGGRGITVCDRWRQSFAAFLVDMGPRPSPRHSIDRIDNNGNYEPGNCRWATSREQNRNRRNNIVLTHDGRTMCLADWARELGVPRGTLLARYRDGQPPDRICSRETTKRHGDAHPDAKLTAEQVRHIRESIEQGRANANLAREYGVARETIRDIRFGKTWKQLV